MRRVSFLVIAGLLVIGKFLPASADTMDWTSADQFDDAMWPYRVERGMQPRDLAVRVVNGNPEYKIVWQAYEGGFSDAIFPTQSRAEAEGLIRAYADPEDAHIPGGDPKLCLHKFARARDGDQEYFLLYMVDPDQGMRCISLPKQ